MNRRVVPALAATITLLICGEAFGHKKIADKVMSFSETKGKLRVSTTFTEVFNKAAYDERADKLVGDFVAAFDKNYGQKDLDPAIVAACPGK